MKSRTIQVILAIVIGVICLYFFQKQVKWGEVWQAMQHVQYSWVVLAVLLNGLSILIRAIRWQAFLGEPKVKVWNLFLIANIGFMGNGIFPARMGELIRPFLVWRTTKHTFPTALATVVVERVYDLLGLLLILAFVLYIFPFPVTPAGTIEPGPTVEQSIAPELEEVPADAAKKPALQIDNPFEWIKGLAKYGVILFLLLFSALGTMTFAPQWSLIVAEKVFSPLPKSLSEKLLKAVESFEKGAATFRKPKEFMYCLFWTMVLWLVIAYGELVVLYAFDIHTVSFSGALFLMVGLCFAVMFPQLPGYIGVYQFAVLTILSKTFFIGESLAGAVSIIMWFTQVPSIILMGFISLVIMGVSFKDISQIQSEIPASEQANEPS